MINYSDILREHHLKATPQRLAIAEALHIKGHINIETLYEIMLKNFNSISLATIYKNINLMLENSFIQEVKIPNAKSVYELTKETHSHLSCEVCGDIEDVYVESSDIIYSVSKKSDFEIKDMELVFLGLCKDCQKVD